MPAIVLGVLFLLTWIVTLFFLPPQNPVSIVAFLALLFSGLFFSTSLIFANTRRGLLFSFGVIVFLILGYWGAGTWLNLVLLLGILVIIEYCLHSRS